MLDLELPDFVKKFRMETVLYSIFLAARSIKHLRRLHMLLPKNCRFLREDLLKLEKLWSNLYSGNPPRGGKGLPDKICKKIFESQCPKGEFVYDSCWRDMLKDFDFLEDGLVGYYVKKLRERSKKSEDLDSGGYTDFRKYTYIYNPPFQPIPPKENFILKISGYKFLTSCYVPEGAYNSEYLFVKIMVELESLTEDLTHCFLEKMPEYHMLSKDKLFYENEGYSCRVLSFVYVFPFDRFKNFVEEKTVVFPRTCGPKDEGTVYIASKKFTDTLKKEFINIGMPIELVIRKIRS